MLPMSPPCSVEVSWKSGEDALLQEADLKIMEVGAVKMSPAFFLLAFGVTTKDNINKCKKNMHFRI